MSYFLNYFYTIYHFKGNFETPKYEYDLMFVKKLWMNTYAGVDQTADLVCHYYQELPKYLAGNYLLIIIKQFLFLMNNLIIFYYNDNILIFFFLICVLLMMNLFF